MPQASRHFVSYAFAIQTLGLFPPWKESMKKKVGGNKDTISIHC